jgi:RNA polymerase sigma-70 factor (ECF subfamily)
VAEDLDQPTDGGAPDLDEVVARYLPRLHAYVRLHMGGALRAREQSLDVVQSICREVLEERGRFEYQGEGQLVSWLLTAATNKLRERARFHGRQKRDADREQAADRVDSRVYASLVTPSQDVVRAERIEALEQALQRLPDEYREVIVLARIVGLSHAEISQRMGKEGSATRNLLGRALTRLADELGSDSTA